MGAVLARQAHDRLSVLDDRFPKPDEIENANMLRTILASQVRSDRPTELRIARDDGEVASVTLAPAVAHSLLELLRHVGQGRMVTVMPTDAELSTQKAADLLNVSRPHLIKLIEGGELACTHTGRHRRLKADDVLRYRARRDAERSAALDELAELDADLI